MAEITGPAAVISILSAVITAVVALWAAWASIVYWLVLVGIFSCVLSAAIRSYPSLLVPSKVIGQQFPLAELKRLPSVMPVALVGPTRTGKTTLLSVLRLASEPRQRTRELTFRVVNLQTSSPVAIIDGAGDEYWQQFEAADAADALIVVLDHSATEDSSTIGPSRLNEHVEFVRQLIAYLSKRPHKPRWIHILINKSDLWLRSKEDALAVAKWSEHTQQAFANGPWTISLMRHSNRNQDDIAAIHRLLAKWSTEWRS